MTSHKIRNRNLNEGRAWEEARSVPISHNKAVGLTPLSPKIARLERSLWITKAGVRNLKILQDSVEKRIGVLKAAKRTKGSQMKTLESTHARIEGLIKKHEERKLK
ncbi:MAG: hypothetical protein V1911_00160 [Candidatus Micrarchaeota archaeon]